MIPFLQAASFSDDRNVALGFAGAPGAVGTLVQLECRNAKNILPISIYRRERERILMPNTLFRVRQAVSHAEALRLSLQTPAKKDLVILDEIDDD